VGEQVMSLEIPISEQIPVDAIRTALISLKTDLWAMQKAPEHPYRQPIIDHAERCKREIEAWLEGVG